MQDAQSQRFLSPLIPFDVFRDHMANRPKKKDDVQEGEEQLKLLEYFLQERIRLRALQHLPVLVHFYKLLTTSLAYRVTEKQAWECTIPAAIDLLDKNHPLRDSWLEFKSAWAGITDFHLREYALNYMTFRNTRAPCRITRMSRSTKKSPI